MKSWELSVLSLIAVFTIFSSCSDLPQSAQYPDGGPSVRQAESGLPGKAGKNAYDHIVGPTESIQNAVDNAQPGDRILVEGGIHEEQVFITKDLTLAGTNGATIRRPGLLEGLPIIESKTRTWRPLVFAYGGSVRNDTIRGPETINVSISGFTIDGTSDPARNLTGIMFRNVKSRGGITGNTVKNMVGADPGPETFGIIVYGDSEVTIGHNAVSDYERGGIGANGDGGTHPAPTVKIVDNTVAGTTGGGWAPNGIQVGFGATGQVSANQVRRNRWSGSRWSASGILVFESDNVKISDNVIEEVDVAVGISSWGWFRTSADLNRATGNRIEDVNIGFNIQGVAWDGFSGTDPTVDNNKIVRNTLDGNGGDYGISVTAVDASTMFDPSVHNNKLIGNSITGFSTPISDQGSASKVQANSKPFNP